MIQAYKSQNWNCQQILKIIITIKKKGEKMKVKVEVGRAQILWV